MTNEEYAIAIKEGHTKNIAALWDNVKHLLKLNCGQWWKLYSERFTECGVTFDDLLQESFLALVDAVAAFDVSTGYKLTTYLRYPIQNRFNALLGNRSYNRSNPLNSCTSLNILIGDDEDCELIDLTPDPYSEQPFLQTERDDYIAYWHSQLEGAMQRKLNKQQKDVVYDFYYARLPRAVIAEKHGLSLNEVRNILRTSLDNLRRDRELCQRYRDEILLDGLYKGTGLSTFRHSQMSTVERSVEHLERKLDEIKKTTGYHTEIDSLLRKEQAVMQNSLDSMRRYQDLRQDYSYEKTNDH